MLTKTAIETFVPANAGFAGQPHTHACEPPPPPGSPPPPPSNSGSGGGGNVVCITVWVQSRQHTICYPV